MSDFSNDRRERAASENELVASLHAGLEFEGRIKVTSGNIRVNTHFKGEIVSEGSVAVDGQGEVEAGIEARQVSIAGKVKGNIHAADLLEIKRHGILLGDIQTRTLIVEAGGYVNGQCQMPIPEIEKHGEK